MQNSDIKKAIDEINNDVYYEKLGSMVLKLQNWLKEKDKLISDGFVTKSELIVAEAVRRQDKISAYYDVFAQFLVQLDELLPKASFESSPTKKQSKRNGGILTKHKSSSSKQISSSPYPSPLQQLKQTWTARKEGLRRLQTSSQSILSNLIKHTDQNNKYLSQLKSQAKKIQNNSEWPISEYCKKFELSVVKKNQKQFQINKIKQAADMFNVQCCQHQEAYRKLIDVHGRLIQGQYFMAECFHGQIVEFNGVVSQCFVGFGDMLVSQSLKFLQNLKTQNNYITQQLCQSSKSRYQTTTILKQKLSKINSEALQQIQITSWNIQLKNKQITSQSQSQYKLKKGIITIDNKFLIVQNQNNNKIVQAEVNLREAIVNQTENIGEIVLKISKRRSQSSKKVVVKFQKPENQDQFLLHLQRAKGYIH